jgi:hypothetical protein
VHYDGTRKPFLLSHEKALAYAEAAANAFAVIQERKAEFRSDVAKGELAKSKEERKASRRR